MQDFKIRGSKDQFYIPNINFIVDSGNLEISGESYLEDTVKFYDPIIAWLKEYLEDTSRKIEFKLKLTYFNTSSAKFLIYMLKQLKDFEDRGGDLTIVWYHLITDEDMVEEIEDFVNETGLDIILYPVKSIEEL